MLYGCGGGALGTLCGGQKTALVWNNSGNVGIGIDSPGVRLDVSGTVRATTFTGDGIGLTNLNATNLTAGTIPASRLPTNVALLTTNASFSGSVNASNATFNGAARITGLLRSGSETGTSETPSPAGLVIRRINSVDKSTNQVLARTDYLTLERDGTKTGLLIRYAANAGYQTINGIAINNAGTFVPVHQTFIGSTIGTLQIFSDSQRIVHAQISFGNSYNQGHFTQVVLDRYDDGSTNTSAGNDFYWVGTLTSTYNQ